MTARYVIGIDLGTTNCALARARIEVAEGEAHEVTPFPILQLVDAGTLEARETLPSFHLVPTRHDFKDGSLALPWDEDQSWCVGTLARDHGARRPDRLIASSKSWLCHSGVDRRAAILPKLDDDDEDIPRFSPVEIARRLLTHLREAWDHSEEGQEAPLAEQEIYLTVPASFDAVARELTVEAAKDAGLGEIVLLEEPLAAFYAWLQASDDSWREQIDVGSTVLVCDVGGGTTDFSLIQAKDEDGDLTLERVAVGEHILLGGDNMDLALAQVVAQKLPKKKLNPWQSRALWYQCREAKEKLLSDAELESAPITILSRGSKLIGKTTKTELTRGEIEAVLLDGFLPECDADAEPVMVASSGLVEEGLPYARDAAITKHVAAFLRDQCGDEQHSPSALLVNGGVFKGTVLRERLHGVLGKWAEAAEAKAPALLAGTHLDLAVATGAAYYGLVKRGTGIRVRGGASRSYYIGVESNMPAVPGYEPPVKAFCVVPFGMEEGSGADVPNRSFNLIVGRPVEFKLYGSVQRQEDVIGEMIEDDELEPTAPLATTLEAEGVEPGSSIKVTLRTEVTEIGTLDLRFVEVDGDRDWKLSFNIREDDTPEDNED